MQAAYILSSVPFVSLCPVVTVFFWILTMEQDTYLNPRRY